MVFLALLVHQLKGSYLRVIVGVVDVVPELVNIAL